MLTRERGAGGEFATREDLRGGVSDGPAFDEEWRRTAEPALPRAGGALGASAAAGGGGGYGYGGGWQLAPPPAEQGRGARRAGQQQQWGQGQQQQQQWG